MSRPFDHHDDFLTGKLGPLISVIEDITDMPVVPNDQIQSVKQLPVVTHYPLMIDDPVFSDPTYNDGLFEATISLDVFARTISQAMQTCSDLVVYLRDRYTRQILRNNGLVIVETSTPQGRSIDSVPFTSVQHYGFDLTVQYYRNQSSPIDRILEDVRINDPRDEED